jgi:hypothetical protein
MYAHTDCQIIVTYRDGNLVWKDFVVDPQDVTAHVVSPTERDVTCCVPTFWSRVPGVAHLKYVRITVDGRTLSLPWPPPDAADRTSTASPELTLHLRLYSDPDKAPTSVAWDDGKQKAFDQGSYALRSGKV